MKSIPFGEQAAAHITQMRDGEAFGGEPDQLVDGNMIPRLCKFAGLNACAQACQFKATEGVAEPKVCAESNITTTLKELDINPENFAMISATKDRVVCGDQIDDEETGASIHTDGYSFVPNTNAFFFRPGVDMTVRGRRQLTNVAMRMADCGDLLYSMTDRDGNDVLGIAHFSRTNMRGPTAYMHEVDGRKVSWGEYVLSNAVDHYGADPASVQIKLAAAVERDDFVHHYETLRQMDEHFPGWDELGYMHPQGETDFDCLIDYREMIEWQLTDSIQDERLKLQPEQIDVSEVANTGDLSLGHASHHAAHAGRIEHGRDMYILGLNRAGTVSARINELERLQSGRRWSIGTFGEMSDNDFDAFMTLISSGDAELNHLYEVQERETRK